MNKLVYKNNFPIQMPPITDKNPIKILEKYGTPPQPSSQKKKTKENEPKNELRIYLDRELEALMSKAIEEENYEFAAKIQKELDRRKKI